MASEVATYMAQWKALLKEGEQKTTAVMAERFTDVQGALKGQLAKLAEDVIAVQEKGEVPSAGLLHQIDTYKKFQTDSAQEFAKYIDWAGDAMAEEQMAAAKGATSATAEALDKKPKPKNVPMDADGLGEEVLAAWDQGAVESMAGLTRGGPLKELLQQGYGVAEQEIGTRLVNGVAKGLNAFEVANDCSDALGLGLDRILCIARTEMNRAYRDSALEAYKSSGLVERYSRMSARDELVCESCLVSDGDTFDVDVEPDDHPNCRCTVVPLLPGEEIEDLGLTDSRAWFDEQDEATQRSILGPGRLAMYSEALLAGEEDAAYVWDRMVSREVHPTWGPTLRATTLKDLSNDVGGLPKDGGSTPGMKLMTKDLAPYPGKAFGDLNDLMPSDALYRAFLETDEGAKAFQAAIDAALGLGPSVDAALVAQHVETVLAKDYQSSGALDYYLKTKGFNLNAEEKAEVKEAWKAQKAEQKLAAKAVAKHDQEVIAQELAAKEAKAAELKATIEGYAKQQMEGATDLAAAVEMVKSYQGGDAVYQQAFHDALVVKFGLSVEAATAQVAHEAKMVEALEVLLGKGYKSPGAADYWLAHAGAKAFALTGDQAKELKASWAKDYKAKKDVVKGAKKAETAVQKAAQDWVKAMEASPTITSHGDAVYFLANQPGIPDQTKTAILDLWKEKHPELPEGATPHRTAQEAHDWLNNEGLSARMYAQHLYHDEEAIDSIAAQSYKATGAYDVNAALREGSEVKAGAALVENALAEGLGPGPLLESTAPSAMLQALDKAVADAPGLPEDTKLFRYIQTKDLESVIGANLDVTIAEGLKFTEAGYASMTLRIDEAAPNTLTWLDVTVKAGERALAMDELGDQKEWELMFGRGRSYTVTGPAWVDAAGRTHLPVEMVPKAAALASPANAIEHIADELMKVSNVELFAKAALEKDWSTLTAAEQAKVMEAWKAKASSAPAAPATELHPKAKALDILKGSSLTNLTLDEAKDLLAGSPSISEVDKAKAISTYAKEKADAQLSALTTAEKAQAKEHAVSIVEGMKDVGELDVGMAMMGWELLIEDSGEMIAGEVQEAIHLLVASEVAKLELVEAANVAGAKPLLYDALSNPAKMKAEEALKAMADAGLDGLQGALNWLAGYADSNGMTVEVRAAVIEKWAGTTYTELPGGAKGIAVVTKQTNSMSFLNVEAEHAVHPYNGVQITSAVEAQQATEVAYNAGLKAMLEGKGDDDIMGAMKDALGAHLGAAVKGAEEGLEQAHLIQTLVHDAALAGIHTEGDLETWLAGTMPDLASTAVAGVLKGLQEYGAIPEDVTGLLPLKVTVTKHITKLGETATGHDEATIAAAKAKATTAAQKGFTGAMDDGMGLGTSNQVAKKDASDAFWAHLSGVAPAAPSAADAALAGQEAGKEKLEDAIATVLAKDYKSSGAVHYWLNSSQGANLSADEKKAVQKAWKDWKAGKAVDPKAEAAKFAGSHVAASTPAPSPTASAGPKLASGSKAKVEAAFQNLPIVAGYGQVMAQIDAMADLSAKENAALKQKWSVANAVSKSNTHPNMTVEEAKQFFGGLGITSAHPAYKDAMEEWGKLKGFDWKAQEKLEAKAAAEQALKDKTAALAQAAFDAGATTGPALDAHLASLPTKPTQKEKAAIQKQVKSLVKEEKAKALEAIAMEKAKAEAAEQAAIFAKAQEFITAKSTLLQVEHDLKAQGATTAQVNKVKKAMKEIRKGGTASYAKAPTAGGTFKKMGAPSAAAVKAFYAGHYAEALKEFQKIASPSRSLKASKRAEDLQHSFVSKWTGGFYTQGGQHFWNGGNYYKSETEFWNRFAQLTGNTGASREKLEKVLAAMNASMNRDEFRLRENTRLMRGFSGWNGEGLEMLKDFIDRGDLTGVQGKRFTSPSYMSSAVASKDWTWGMWTLNIDAPAGMGGFPAQMVSGYKSEIEWLLPRNLTFEVREVCYGKNALGEGTAGRWNVFVDVVGKWDKDGRLLQDYSLPVKDDPTAPVRNGSAYEAAAKKAAAEYVAAHPGESPVWLN